jgi:hypothetical protein
MSHYHRGPENAQSNGVIAGCLGYPDIGINGRLERPNSSLFTEDCDACVTLGFPIIAGGNGYFYATMPSQFEHYLDHCATMARIWSAKHDAALRCIERWNRLREEHHELVPVVERPPEGPPELFADPNPPRPNQEPLV